MKRAFDFLISFIALVLLVPVLGYLVFAIRRKLGRPSIFRQVRVGRAGAPFVFLKFRSMTDERDAEGHLLPDEKRLTPFGATLRRLSLDELPQLVNVLRGEMSIVGPRPLLPEYLEYYTPQQLRRHDVSPGITGLAQVSGRNAISWDEKLNYDIEYVDNQSMWLDLRIIFTTIKQVFRAKDISAPGHVSMPRLDEEKKSARRCQP